MGDWHAEMRLATTLEKAPEYGSEVSAIEHRTVIQSIQYVDKSLTENHENREFSRFPLTTYFKPPCLNYYIYLEYP
jgi:hypothetical protein